jgi:DNA-binding NtrC family response regulator
MAGQTRSATATATRVLLVDDDPLMVQSFAGLLEGGGCDVSAVRTIGEAMQLLRGSVFGVVLAEVAMPDRDGYELLRYVKANCPGVPVILVTSYGTVEGAVEAVKRGAFNYLTKPLTREELLGAVAAAVASGERLSLDPPGEASAEAPAGPPEIIAQDYRMAKVLEMADAVARTRTTVLVTGESGTGKSLVARHIHARSPRRGGAFVEVACGALTDTLLASELFGHVRGAFTGAAADKEGKFAAADGGTIFLDEVATASPQMQVKLLRVLQERVFEPVGSNEPRRADVRVILATNRDLRRDVEEGRFREDLYYRVNVVNIHLPALRERPGDVPLLAEHFLRRFARPAGRRLRGISDEARAAMRAYDWPGNIRELENCVERAVVLCRGPWVEADDLPPAVAAAAGKQPDGGAAGETLRAALAEPERRLIVEALDASDGNRQAAAKQLGINRSTLYKKMKRLGLM